ncbi:hypothetical protein WR25_05705 [Diploscapter pachys]|uniref:C2H2-type domain-containing protein n=1 Tax=Diploscapter pachys TaxID=2018661 RepID=A0A2A2LTJ3_9BILA|nr:hypothetical protein WR25_05705 [Diploscapter pachys]
MKAPLTKKLTARQKVILEKARKEEEKREAERKAVKQEWKNELAKCVKGTETMKTELEPERSRSRKRARSPESSILGNMAKAHCYDEQTDRMEAPSDATKSTSGPEDLVDIHPHLIKINETVDFPDRSSTLTPDLENSLLSEDFEADTDIDEVNSENSSVGLPFCNALLPILSSDDKPFHYVAHLPLPRFVNMNAVNWDQVVPLNVQSQFLRFKPLKRKPFLRTPTIVFDELQRKKNAICSVFGADVRQFRVSQLFKYSSPSKSTIRSVCGNTEQHSDQIGHLLSRCLTGSVQADNLILQNLEANNRLSTFDSCLANILVSNDTNRADILWKFSYHPENRTKRPDVVQTIVKICVKEVYSCCIDYSYENRVGRIAQLVDLNRKIKPLLGNVAVNSKPKITLPEFLSQSYSNFSSFEDQMRLKYPSFTEFNRVEPNGKGLITPHITMDSQRIVLFDAEYTIEDKRLERKPISQDILRKVWGFDCGHVLPAFLLGSDSRENLYCQNAEINQTMCYTFEKDLNKLLSDILKVSEGNRKKVNIKFLAEFKYDNSDFPTVPSSINYGYRIFQDDNVSFEIAFNLPNPSSCHIDAYRSMAKFYINPTSVLQEKEEVAGYTRTLLRNGSMKFTDGFCYICSTPQFAIMNHMKIHSEFRSFVCDEQGCGRAFKLQSKLNEHKKFVHSNVRLFICDVQGCGKGFKTRSELNQHKKLTHSALRSFICHVQGCGRAFKLQSKLNKHKKSVHSNVRLFICDVQGCGKGFKTRSELNQHKKNVHSNARLFICDVQGCGKGFKTRSDLNKHKKK